ncbi:MAG: polysaccharide deacetylase family protein [bacterium]
MNSKFFNYFYPNIMWRMRDHNIYLTFDDGPDKDITPKLLDLLQKYNIEATFFLLGQKAECYPDIVKDIQSKGHTIGNHSYSHQRMLGKSKQQIVDEINKTNETLLKVTGQKPRLFRPPYGIFGMNLLNVLEKTKHKMVLWSCSVGDFKKQATSRKIKKRIIKLVEPKQIILLHDGHPNSKYTLEALEESLGRLKDRGLKFSAIPDNSIY